MNSLERVVKTLNREEADHVPVYPLCNSISWKRYGISYEEWSKDHVKCAEAIIKTTEELDLDVITTLVDLSVEAADFGMKVKYHPAQAAGPSEDKFINKLDEYEKVVPINPRETERMGKMIKMTKILADRKGHECPIVGFVFAPLGVLSMLTGLEMLMKDCYKKKSQDTVKKAVAVITDVLIDYCDALIDAGAHAIMIDTLFASKSIMSPKMWDEFEGVYTQKIAEHVHARGKYFMIHNCGEGIYIKEQMERMHPEAISLLHLSPDCKTMEELKEKYGSQTTIIGHVDPGYLMTCSEDDLRKLCRKQIDAYKKDGGFILATGCEYPAVLDDELAKVMVDEAKNYGKY
jgi:uroporphyrinogen decarboxylase